VLNDVYAELRGVLEGGERKQLQLAQTRWIAAREQRCGGSEGADLSNCIAEATRARIALLRGAPESGPGIEAKIIPFFVQQEGGGRRYEVDYALVRFLAPRRPGEQLLNSQMQSLASEAPQGPGDFEAPEGMTLSAQATARIAYASPKLVSVAVDFWRFDGGAHGNGGVTNINIDPDRSEPPRFSDVFDPADQEALTASCRGQVLRQKVEKSGEADYQSDHDPTYQDSAISAHVGDFSRWTFSAESATITFDAYAIGSFAEGPYECVFAMGHLRGLARDAALLPEE
jgi:hypothetical protein